MSRSVAALALLSFLSCAGEADVCRAITANKERFVEGLVIARFNSFVTEEQATHVVEEDSFHVESFVGEGSNLAARVAVPTSEECESMEKLRESSSILSVGLELRPHSE